MKEKAIWALIGAVLLVGAMKVSPAVKAKVVELAG